MRKHIFNTYIVTAVMALSVLVTACGGDEPAPDDSQPTDRAYLEESASLFLSKIKPINQQQLISAFSYFVGLCQNYTFPANFYDQDVARLRQSAADMLEVLENDDYLSYSRATAEFVYSMARFKGMYQANSNTDEWQFIESRDHVNMRFWYNNKEYNILVSGSGGEWNATIPTDYADYVFNVPKTLTITMYPGNVAQDMIISSQVTSDGKDGNYLNTTVTGRYANVEVNSTTKASNTKIKQDYGVYIHDVATYYRYPMVVGSVEIAGSGLCSIEAWKKVADSSNPVAQMASMLSSGNSTVEIIERVNVKSQVSNLKMLVDAVCNNEFATQSDAQTVAANLSKAVDARVYYLAENSAKVRATMGWQECLPDDTPGAQVWGIRPTITFTSDGATYDFRSFFGNDRFLSIERQYMTLLQQYKSFWKK